MPWEGVVVFLAGGSPSPAARRRGAGACTLATPPCSPPSCCLLCFLVFQVRYKFVPAFLLAEPLLLVGAFAVFFLLCACYVRMDLTIAKSSPAYQAKLQTDLVSPTPPSPSCLLPHCCATAVSCNETRWNADRVSFSWKQQTSTHVEVQTPFLKWMGWTWCLGGQPLEGMGMEWTERPASFLSPCTSPISPLAQACHAVC